MNSRTHRLESLFQCPVAAARQNAAFFAGKNQVGGFLPSQGCIKLAKSPVPAAGRAGSPLPAASHGWFAALRGLSALPRVEPDAVLLPRRRYEVQVLQQALALGGAALLLLASLAASAQTVEVKVAFSERLGPLYIDRMALGQGGLSEEPMWADRIPEVRALHPRLIRLFIQEQGDVQLELPFDPYAVHYWSFE